MRVSTGVKRTVWNRPASVRTPRYDLLGRREGLDFNPQGRPVDVGEVSITVDVNVAHVGEALMVLERAYHRARSELESVTYTPPPQDEVKS